MDARRFRKRLLRQLATVAQLTDACRKITSNPLFRLQALIMGGCRLLVYRIWVTIRSWGWHPDALRCALFGGSHIYSDSYAQNGGENAGRAFGMVSLRRERPRWNPGSVLNLFHGLDDFHGVRAAVPVPD